MSPDAFRDPTNDQNLDAEQLRAKYDDLAQDGEWGQHPDHPMEQWRTEVQCKTTRLGYWDWVVTKLKRADGKDHKDPVLADAEEEEIAELQADDPGNQGA
jgi:hypothetical protein